MAYDPRVARPKWRTIILALAILAMAIYGGDRYRYPIKAIVWHVRHGDSTTVGAYRIPVPRYWFVEQDSFGDAQLMNSRTGEGILAKSRPWPLTMNLDLWVGLETRLKDPKFVTLVRRDLRVGGEPLVCLEKDLIMDYKSIAIHGSSVNCMSAGQLEVTFFGGMRDAPRYDYSEFYRILSSIQKK